VKQTRKDKHITRLQSKIKKLKKVALEDTMTVGNQTRQRHCISAKTLDLLRNENAKITKALQDIVSYTRLQQKNNRKNDVTS
jgi:hypothetical protein